MKEHSLEDLYKELVKGTEDIPPERLSELSDLNRKQVQRFASVWEGIPIETRQVILEQLGHLAFEHIELRFGAINRIALNDPDPTVRHRAIDNLWESKDERLIPKFLEALEKDPSEEVRSSAGTALGRFVYLGELAEISRDLLYEVVDRLLVASVDDPSHEVQLSCIRSLGYSGRTEVISRIERAYHADSVEELSASITAMGRSANSRWREQVLEQLRHPEPAVRREAVKATGELDLREGVDELIDLLDDVHEDVRQAAIQSLGQLGGDEAAEALKGILEEPMGQQEERLVQDALDYLAFVEGTRDMLLFDFDDIQDELD